MTMFDQPGIALDDLTWIQCDEFVHYFTLAYELGHPSDWSAFRQDLLIATAAAFGLEAGSGEAHCDRQDILDRLDGIRREHDPVRDWPGFMERLWAARHQFGRAGDPCR